MKSVKAEFFIEMKELGFELLEVASIFTKGGVLLDEPYLSITMIHTKDGLDHELTVKERTKIINLSKKYNASVSIARKYWGGNEYKLGCRPSH